MSLSFSESLKNFLNNLKCKSKCCESVEIVISGQGNVSIDLDNTSESNSPPIETKDQNTSPSHPTQEQ